MGFSTQDIKTNPSMSISAVVKGAFISLCSTIILSLFTGLIMNLTSLSEAHLPSIALSIMTLSTVGGGWLSANLARQNGLVHGLGAGIVFIIVALLISSIALPTTFELAAIIKKILFCAVGGCLGGVLGVGSK